MANGVQLATAYISLNVRTDDIKKQISSAFNTMGSQGKTAGAAMGRNIAAGLKGSVSAATGISLFRPMEIAGVRWAVRAGSAIGSTLKKALTASLAGFSIGGLLGAGSVLTAGLDRLKTIQRAQVQLSLKLSPDEIKKVTDEITQVVQGTPIALDEALQAVPRALSAGIKPGKELQQYVKDIADAAASTGGQAGFGQIDIIFSQILGKGKLMGEELMQLTENGVDLRSALKDAFNWDDKTLNKNIEKGKVGMREVQIAVEKTWGKDGGLAKKMGQTFDGAVGNLKASIARLGANFIGAIFGKKSSDDPLKNAAEGLTSLTENLDKAGKWVTEHRDDIHNVFVNAGKAISWTKDKVTTLVNWFKQAWRWGQDAASAVGRTWDRVSTILGNVKTKIGDIVGDMKKKFDDVFGPNGWFAQQFKKLGEIVDRVREVLGLGPATANAAPGGSAPFNAGPMAPGAKPPSGSAGGSSGGGGIGGSFRVGAPIPGSGTATAQKPTDPWASEWKLTPSGKPGSTKPEAAVYDPKNPRKVGSDVNLLPDTVKLKDRLTTMFSDVETVYGYRDSDAKQYPNEHVSGKAFDMMLPSQLIDPKTGKPTKEGIDWGNRLVKEALANGADYAIWQHVINYKDGSSEDQGVTGNNTTDHYDHVHVHVPDPQTGYASGGGVWGAGTATSDSIPAMLSSGEHVLTADDVKKMGGQGGVYAFRSALQSGKVPGFAPGGAVDPQDAQDAKDNVYDLNSARVTAQKQLAELPEDATDRQRLEAQINADKTQRDWEQANADLPIILSGGEPPDRSLQNNVFDTTDTAKLALAQLDELRTRQSEGDDIAPSQMQAAEAAANAAQRERDQAIGALQGRNKPNYLDQFRRSMGYMPSAAANTGVAGTSSLSSIIGMGNEVVGGLIDTGASLLQSAVKAGTAAGAIDPAAGMAGQMGIQIGASVLKRLSSYGFQLGSIGADALIAQITPFGAPRWAGYDYTQLMPQMGFQQAALTTIEKMGNDAINKYFNKDGQVPPLSTPPSPASPASIEAPPASDFAGAAAAGSVPAGPPTAPPNVNTGTIGPGSGGTLGDPNVAVGTIGPGSGGTLGASPLPPIIPPDLFGGFAKGGAVSIYDDGGVLKPGDLALNASRRPEKVLNDKQWDALAKIQPAGRDAPLVKIDTIYGLSPEDVAAQIEAKQKLAMMRYAGRP